MPRQTPILIVDDNDNDLYFLTRILQKSEHPKLIVTAHDGSEAQKHLQTLLQNEKPLPHVVITDMEMPNVDGLTLVR